MPWELKPPRKGKTPNYYVRGTYLGIRLDDSTGTAELRAAKTILKTWRGQAERGEFRKKVEPVQKGPPTFLRAAVAYMQAGGETDYIEPILAEWGETLLSEIDQTEIDRVASKLYPLAPATTKNRCFYTPVSAVLKRAGVEKKIKRPVGWRGKRSTSWLEQEQAFSLFDTATKIEPEFGLFCAFLCYTGMRLSEALGIQLRDLKLDRSFVYLPDSKNGEPRGCHLPPFMVKTIKKQPPRKFKLLAVKGGRRGFQKGAGEGGRSPADAGVPFLKRDPESKLFRFHKGSALDAMLKKAMRASGLSFPKRQGGFHIFCHTYGSWMHRYGELDTHGLTRTGRWSDPDSADRYVHTGASEEARRADWLPTPKRGQGVERKVGKR